MKVKISNQKFLIFAVLYAACTAAIHYFTPGIIATVLLFPFFIFLPGYAFLSLVFPYRNSMGKLAMVFTGIGASIGLVTLISLIVALTPWGLNPASTVVSTLIFNIVFAAAAITRNLRVPRDRQPYLELSLPAFRPAVIGGNRLERLLTAVLLAFLLITSGAVVFSLVSPPEGEQYTEFYILPSISGNDKYPLSSIAGQPAAIKLVIVNHEKQKQSYSIETRFNRKSISKNATGDLAPGQKLEIPINALIDNPGPNQKLEFYLYKAGEAAPLLNDALSITLDVASAAK